MFVLVLGIILTLSNIPSLKASNTKYKLKIVQ